MDEGEGQTDDETAEGTVVRLLGGDAEDGQNEYEGQEALDQQTCDDALIHARETVGAEAARHILHAAETEDRSENACARESAEALGDDVADEVSHAHAARDEHAERYRGVDVAARDVADAVSHADDDKTERQSGQDVAAAVRRVAADEHRGAAAEYHENHGADKFGDELFDRIHSITPP